MLKNSFSFLALALICMVGMTACSKSSDSSSTKIGDWVHESDFDGPPRSEAVVAVSSDNKAYIGLGYNGRTRLNDFYVWQTTLNSWTKLPDFPGTARASAIAFSVKNKLYVGFGSPDGAITFLKDLWKYDPVTQGWTNLGNAQGDEGGPSARYQATTFVINDVAYMSCGYDSLGNIKDLWQYDDANNKWLKKESPGGSKRKGGVAFVLNNKAYLCTGENNGSYNNDMWMYDPSTQNWTEMRHITNYNTDQSYDDNYTNIIRRNGVAFTIGGKGYVASGSTNSGNNGSVWEYDPSSDLWTEKTGFEGVSRVSAVGFTLNDRGFLTTGTTSTTYFDDFWEFKPNDAQNSNNN